MRTRSDVVIIGGGAIGSSIAYQLASDGVSVTIIERDSIASHASGFSGGLLNPTSESGKLVPLHHQSFHMFRELLGQVQQESGVDAQVVMMPHIELALTEDAVPFQRTELERISQFPEFNSEWLEPEDVWKLEPRITQDLYGGVLVEDVIILDSYNLTLAMAQAAEARGAEIVLREATGIVYEKDRAVGLGGIYMKRVLEQDDVSKLVEILDQAGAKEFSAEKAQELVNQAIEALNGTSLTDQGLENLQNLGQQVLDGRV